jgi:hypothetical protein
MTEVPVAPFVFNVTTKPTSKRTAYAEVNAEFGQYIDFLDKQYQKDIRREGILTIDGQPFVAVKDLTAKIDECLAAHQEGKEGISQDVALASPADFTVAVPEVISVVIGRDYSALSESNARAYLEARAAVEQANGQANSFKSVVLGDSLTTVGATKDTLAEVVALAYAFEHWTFVNQLEPRKTPKHKDILYAFIKEAPEKIRSNSRMGDLTLAGLMADDVKRALLEKKGLLPPDFVSDYRPSKRDGGVYVRLQGVADRLKMYTDTLLTKSVEQNISLHPTERA